MSAVERLLAEWKAQAGSPVLSSADKHCHMTGQLEKAIEADREGREVKATVIGKATLGDGGLNLTFLLRGDDAAIAKDLPYGSEVRILPIGADCRCVYPDKCFCEEDK